MISLPDRASIERTLTAPVRADLKDILHARIRHTLEARLGDLTHIVVVEKRDSEQTIIEAIGFTPLANPIDGLRYRSPGYEPGWAWLSSVDHGGFEMVWTIGDSGYAVILLIEDTSVALAQLCRVHVGNLPDP